MTYRVALRKLSGWIGVVLAASVAGCSTNPPRVNPSFNVPVEQAEQALAELRETPTSAERPVLVVGGYFDLLGTQIDPMRDELVANFGEDAVLRRVHFAFDDFDRLRDRLVELVDEKFGPGDDPERTIAVDAVGLSMGGLVCRYAAMPVAGQRSLNLRRLYTVATPHRGAALGTRWSLDGLVRDMAIGSDFMRRLEAGRVEATCELVSYVRLDDGVVGEVNAAPLGDTPIWVEALPWTRPHAHALRDPRLQADILRRLRRLEPFSREPRIPLPD
jgi:hypothetical protein